MTRIPANRILCCGSNRQIHTDYRSPVEKKGRAWPLSKSERARGLERAQESEPTPLPGQASIAFLGTLHWGCSSFTMHRFSLGGYLLQKTKERMLLITSKRMIFANVKGKVVELVTLILGRFNIDFRKLL